MLVTLGIAIFAAVVGHGDRLLSLAGGGVSAQESRLRIKLRAENFLDFRPKILILGSARTLLGE